MGGRGWAGWSGVMGGKWENCNSIINKYIKRKNLVCVVLDMYAKIIREYKPRITVAGVRTYSLVF